jgi:hypothetical protein
MKHLARLFALCLALNGLALPLSVHAQSWTFCAAENTLCRVNGANEVRFGVGDRFEHRQVTGPVMCSSRVFGDPAPGERKDCSFRPASAPWQGNAPGYGQEAGWQTCAGENGFCAFSGSQQVRYGAEGRYRTRSAFGGLQCDNRTFGGDPVPGQPKQCQIKVSTSSGYPNRPGMAGDGNLNGWRHCAEENQTCIVPTTATVRFGAQGRYTQVRGVNGHIACSIQVFGDPIYGERKSCEYSVPGYGASGAPGYGGSSGSGSWEAEQPMPVYPATGYGGNEQGWAFCANEDSACHVPGVATVRFGAQGRYTVINQVNGHIPCTKEVFGDPIEGIKKTCEYATMR